jgi:hypothetical protein
MLKGVTCDVRVNVRVPVWLQHQGFDYKLRVPVGFGKQLLYLV